MGAAKRSDPIYTPVQDWATQNIAATFFKGDPAADEAMLAKFPGLRDWYDSNQYGFTQQQLYGTAGGPYSPTPIPAGAITDAQVESYLTQEGPGQTGMGVVTGSDGKKYVKWTQNLGTNDFWDKLTSKFEPALALSGAGPGISNLVGGLGVSGGLADVLSGAVRGGVGGLMTGGLQGGVQGALTGGLTSGVTSGLTGSDLGGWGNDEINNLVTQVGDNLTGGDIFSGVGDITNFDDTDTGVTNTTTGGSVNDIIENAGNFTGGPQDLMTDPGIISGPNDIIEEQGNVTGGGALGTNYTWGQLGTMLGLSSANLTNLQKLGRIFGGGSGGGSGDLDLGRILGVLGSTGLGIYGSDKYADTLKAIADQSRADRQPFLDKSLEWLNNPAAYTAGPGAAGVDAALRGLSVNGNPFGSATSLALAGDVANKNWQNAVTGFGNLGLSGSDSRNAMLAGAANANSGKYDAVGYGLENLFNPKQQGTNPYDLMKMFGIT